MAIRVVVLDDAPLMRHGVDGATRAHADVEIVASGPMSELRALLSPQPDVVLLGLSCRTGGRAEVGRVRLALPDTPILAFADDDQRDGSGGTAFLQAGADGFVCKTAPASVLIEALRRAAGRAPSARARRSPAGSRLTPRELDVLARLATGLTNAQIGEVLFVSAGTVKTHVSSILRKLDVTSRAEAVAEGFRRRLV